MQEVWRKEERIDEYSSWPRRSYSNPHQWSATYRRIFEQFPEYDFLSRYQRDERPLVDHYPHQNARSDVQELNFTRNTGLLDDIDNATSTLKVDEIRPAKRTIYKNSQDQREIPIRPSSRNADLLTERNRDIRTEPTVESFRYATWTPRTTVRPRIHEIEYAVEQSHPEQHIDKVPNKSEYHQFGVENEYTELPTSPRSGNSTNLKHNEAQNRDSGIADSRSTANTYQNNSMVPLSSHSRRNQISPKYDTVYDTVTSPSQSPYARSKSPDFHTDREEPVYSFINKTLPSHGKRPAPQPPVPSPPSEPFRMYLAESPLPLQRPSEDTPILSRQRELPKSELANRESDQAKEPEPRVFSPPTPIQTLERGYSGSSSSSPQSILKKGDSPKNQKRVSIEEQPLRVRFHPEVHKVVNDIGFGNYIQEVIDHEFPNQDIDVKLEPQHGKFETLMKVKGPEKEIYFTLNQNVNISNDRPKRDIAFTSAPPPPPPPPPQPPTPANAKKPLSRMSSAQTNASTSTSLFEELRSVQKLLNLDQTVVEDPKWKDTGASSWKHVPVKSPEFDPNDPEMIAIVRRKVEKGQVLDWPELFILKTFHMTTVVPMEQRLFRLLASGCFHENVDELRSDLEEEYEAYEKILSQSTVRPSSYTTLARDICLSDAYWFHARIMPDGMEQDNLYRKAIDGYAALLEKAEKTLHPDDPSLLDVVEKIAQLLAESRNYDPKLVLQTVLATERAERALARRPETESRKRLQLVKQHLAELNRYCQVPV